MMRSPRPAIWLMVVALGVIALSLHTPVAASADDSPTTSNNAAQSDVDPSETPQLDMVPPAIVQPSDVVAAAVDASGATVTYGLPAATDDTSGVVPVSCAPAAGSLFPLGRTPVACAATDAAGNQATVSFAVTVTDQTPPVIATPTNVSVDAVDTSGSTVNYTMPSATDNVDGTVAVGCDLASGVLFPVGATTVNCWAQDATGNAAQTVSFTITVIPPPEPTATMPPTAPAEPTASAEPTATPTRTPKPARTPTTSVAAPTATATVPPALRLPWPPPSSISITDGGPIDGLAAIWGNQDFPITQEFSHTSFSIAHFAWYAYGLAYGLDGYEHPGIDIGMPAGTWLYSPVNGTVKVAGGMPFYTYYGNGQPGVGELLIETDDGDQVVLGHMGLIVVHEGQRVEAGEFVGLSGGDNGDHLHLETREAQTGGSFRIVDPRRSFLIEALKEAARRDADESVDGAPG